MITNHKVHQGISMHSGTLEHICIDPEGQKCYCGQKGCLETYCSANALEARAKMTVKEFFPALREGKDARLVKIWDEYLSHLAYAMKTANLMLDGAWIVSGYLAPYFTEEDCKKLLAKVNAINPFPIAREQLLLGTHGQYTPAVGAALLFVEKFLQSEL
ncbi:ROK family protein [Fusicatenibacter sp.]